MHQQHYFVLAYSCIIAHTKCFKLQDGSHKFLETSRDSDELGRKEKFVISSIILSETNIEVNRR